MAVPGISPVRARYLNLVSQRSRYKPYPVVRIRNRITAVCIRHVCWLFFNIVLGTPWYISIPQYQTFLNFPLIILFQCT
jgi:hypothetical protein